MCTTVYVHVGRCACRCSYLVLESSLEVVEVQWLLIIIAIQSSGNVFLFPRNFILDRQLVILGALSLRRNHEDVMQGYDHRVVIVQILSHLELLSQEESVLLNHLIDHLLHHSQVLHYVILSHTLTLLKLFEPLGSFVIFTNEREYLLDAGLDGVDLVERGLVLSHVLLVALLVLLDLLLKLLLQLLPLVVLTQPLILVLFNLFLDILDLLIKLLSLLGELTHKLAQREVPLLSLDEVADQLVDVLGACGFGNAREGFLVLLELLLGDHALRGDFAVVAIEAPESLLRLPLEVELLLRLGLFVESFKLVLLLLLSFHKFFHLFFFLDFEINLLYLLIEIGLLLLGLPDQVNELPGGLLAVLRGTIRYRHDLVHLPLLGLEIASQLGVYLFEDEPLPAQRVDLIAHLLVVGDCRVELLVRLVQPVLERLDLLDEFAVLLLRRHTVHAFLLFQNVFLDFSYLVVNVSLSRLLSGARRWVLRICLIIYGFYLGDGRPQSHLLEGPKCPLLMAQLPGSTC